MRVMEKELRKNDRRQEFNGIIIDTGANRTSMMSLDQYIAYCREHNVPARIADFNRSVRGIGGVCVKTIGKATVAVPFPDIGVVCDITFHITEGHNPTLLSLRDLKNTGLDLSIQKNCVHMMGKSQKLVHENDFLYYRWKPDLHLYTYGELRKLHRSFGHPTVSALQKVLKQARPAEMTNEVKQAVQEIVNNCQTCNELASKPKRFRLSIGAENSRFNHVILADIMYIDQKPVLHVIDEATHFSSATFLPRVTSKDVWKALLRTWIYTYMGPPDHLKIDQGSNFVSKEFKGSASVLGINLIEAPVESPASMSVVERYHGPLRIAYQKLRRDLPKDSKTAILQWAVHCVNSTVGPEGICPVLCVFGAMPRPLRASPAPDQIERARAIDNAIDTVTKEHSKRKVAFGLKYRGPYGKESSSLDKLQFGAPVRVFRETSKKWEGPFKFVWKEGETVCVQLSHGRKIFRSHAVKYDRSVPNATMMNEQEGDTCIEDTVFLSIEDVVMANSDNIAVLAADDEDPDDFSSSRAKELNGLNSMGVFKVVDKSDVPDGQRIYGTRFVDQIKEKDGRKYKKSRLIAQNYQDHDARTVPTKSPTVSRMGMRIALSTAAMHPSNLSYTRDITQAYIQSEYPLERRVFLRPPQKMHLPENKVLLVIKPLYGIPEAGLYWFVTYKNHHVGRLGMKQCTTDPCILYRKN